MRKANTTILDVAARAGVSKTTASNILRSGGGVYKKETISQVKAVATELGYQPNAAARLLRQQKTNLVGLAVPVWQTTRTNRLMREMHDVCLRHGYQPTSFDPCNLLPSNDHAPFPSVEMLSALISIDFMMEHELPSFYASLRTQLPCVALYAVGVSGVDAVSTDYGRGVEMAVEHLVGLGHRRIAFAEMADSSSVADRLKLAAWRHCVTQFDLAQDPHYLIPLNRAVENGDIWHMGVDIAHAVIQMPEPPSALLCPNDDAALIVMSQLTAAGWQLPRDLSIVGFDGLAFSAHVRPALTTIRQPVEAIAEEAFTRLLQAMSASAGRPFEPQQQMIAPQLIVRESTQKYPGLADRR